MQVQVVLKDTFRKKNRDWLMIQPVVGDESLSPSREVEVCTYMEPYLGFHSSTYLSR